jgi:hypothetical protein
MSFITVALIGAGASLLGGSIAASGARSAGDTQAAAAKDSGAMAKEIADQQLALQTRQYEEGVARQQPFLTAGTNALARMQAGEFTQPGAFNVNDPRYAQPDAFKFGMSDFVTDPGYNFRLSEGQKALDRSAAARGGLISGGALKAATRYGQDMGSQEYQNAYQRALTGYGTKVDRSNTAFSRGLTGYNADVARADTGYNRLASMAGVGQTTTAQLNAAGTNYANTASNTLGNYSTAAGNAITAGGQGIAAGQLGVGNTINSALNTGASAYLNQMNFNNYLANQNNQRGLYGGAALSSNPAYSQNMYGFTGSN